jgi:hypothetical protein
MSIKHIGWARLALRQQVEFFGGDQVSLDSLWRSVASPAGHDPHRWSELAAPLLSGFSTYLDRLYEGAESKPGLTKLLWIWEDESKDPWRTGDLMSHEFIAWTYATYLDTHVDRQPSRHGGVNEAESDSCSMRLKRSTSPAGFAGSG